MKQFISKSLAIELRELRFYKPSLYFHEWSGSDEIEECTNPCWYVDGITTYTANQIKRELPKNVGINPNVTEFGILSTDSIADRRAKVLIYLLRNQLITTKWRTV